nr:hypothetical protein [Providencia rettgeri]
GTVTTTANSNKLVGTGTKWKENINGIQPQQVIQIIVGGIVYNSSIQSIESDTTLTLNFPFHAAVKDAKYVILTTMVNSVSSAANYMVALNTSNMHARDVANDWMTKDGVIPMTAPDGTKVNLRTAKEMDKQLDGKFDKTGGTITRNGAALTLKNIVDGNNHYLQFQNADGKRRAFIGFGSDTNKNLSIVNDDLGSNFTLKEGGATVNGADIVKVGDFGVGKNSGVTLAQSGVVVSDYRINGPAYCYGDTTSDSYNKGNHTLFNIFAHASGRYGAQFGFAIGGKSDFGFRMINNNAVLDWCTIYHTGNTTKDSNGNLKAASPIIRVFSDHVDPNEEAEGVTLKKLHTGIYQLHGVLGLHSDASWGGINGGITIPCGINQLPLVYALYDVLEKGKQHPFDGRIVEPDEDGDIVLYTTYRKHDLPQNIQYERFKLYPEFLKEVDGEKVELTPGEPCDIPVGHWVDVRVNMPSNSIYNQKQAEAERLAKIEAERLAQEAKRAAEEAERAEQEAAEQVEKQ